MLAHLGNMRRIRGGVKGEVDHWPLMAEWIERKTKVNTIERNGIEVTELVEGFSRKVIQLQTAHTILFTFFRPVALEVSWKSGRSNSVIISATSPVTNAHASHAFRKDSGASEHPMDRETRSACQREHCWVNPYLRKSSRATWYGSMATSNVGSDTLGLCRIRQGTEVGTITLQKQ